MFRGFGPNVKARIVANATFKDIGALLGWLAEYQKSDITALYRQ